MFKFLKTSVPVIQVLVAFIVYNLAKLFPLMHGDESYTHDLVRKLNFPIEFSMVLLDRVVGFLHFPEPTEGPLFSVIAGIFFIAVICCVPALWYVVVVEIEMRTKKTSMLRSSSLVKQILISAILLTFGLAAIIDLYSYRIYFHPMSKFFFFLREFILLAWAVPLLGTAIYDLWMAYRDRTAVRL
jgi:hypothetical protein